MFRRVICQNELGDTKGIKQGGCSTDWGGANASLSYVNKPEAKRPGTGIRERKPEDSPPQATSRFSQGNRGSWGQSSVFLALLLHLLRENRDPWCLLVTSSVLPAPSLLPLRVRALSLEYFPVSIRQNLSILSGPWWSPPPSTVQSLPLALFNSVNYYAGVRYPAGCLGHKNQQTAALLPPPGPYRKRGVNRWEGSR